MSKWLTNEDLLIAAERLAEALTAATGDTWTQTQIEQPWIIARPDNLRIEVVQAWHAQGRLTLKAVDEEGREMDGLGEYQPDGTMRTLTVSITLSPDRDPKDQAQDVVRRLLPDARIASTIRNQSYQFRRELDAARSRVRDELVAACGSLVGVVNQDVTIPPPSFIWSLGPQHHDTQARVEVSYSGSTRETAHPVVHLHLNYLPPDLARAVLETVRDHQMAETAAAAAKLAEASWRQRPGQPLPAAKAR